MNRVLIALLIISLSPAIIGAQSLLDENQTLQQDPESNQSNLTYGNVTGIFTPSNPSATKKWGSIDPGDEEIFIINEKNISLTEIKIAVNNHTSNSSITVSRLPDQPTAGKPRGKVYQYIEINHSNLDGVLTTVTMTFFVNSSWINNHSIVPSSVTLNRFADGSWERIDTILMRTGKNYNVYKAQSSGLSYFSISGEVLGQICDEGEKRCSGTRIEFCNVTSWELSEDCQFDCENQACMEPICEAGQLRCNGDSLEQCSVVRWTESEFCEYGCNEKTLTCIPFIDWNIVLNVVIFLLIMAAIAVAYRVIKHIKKRMNRPKTTEDALRWRP